MKKLILLTLMISFFYELKSQTYFPFRTDTAQWNMETFDNSGYFDTYSYTCFINGDTIIDSVKYSKIYNGNYVYDTILDTANAAYWGGLREDTNKHIFFKPSELYQGFSFSCSVQNNSLDEFLLYRFDIIKDDTFTLSHYWPGSTLYTVANVDSVQIGSAYRKRFQIISANSQAFFDDYWIEGIGSQFSLFGPYCYFFEQWDILLCYKEPNINYIGMYNWEGICKYNFVGYHNTLFPEINIYPNPAKRMIHIDNIDNMSINKIKIMNSLGQQEMIIDPVDKTINKIDISHLQHGLYIIEIQTNNFIIRKKIIIEQ